ncbi:MAG: DUF4127 family protein [Acidobacteria bacterium]|nr:DUF4127 family protein [Acidobacteriota bacterium]
MIGKAASEYLYLRFATAILIAVFFCEALMLAQSRPRLRPLQRNYFAGKFLMLPQDSRPVSLQTPRLLARVADHDLVLPSVDLLGDDARGPDLAGLAEWLLGADFADLDGLILSLDSLPGEPVRKLELLAHLRARSLHLPVYGFTADDRTAVAVLDALDSGALDYLLVARDEPVSNEGGSSDPLDARIAGRGLAERAAVIIGRDGGAQLLVARMLLQRFGLKPKIWLGASATPHAARLAPQLTAQVAVIDGQALPGSPEAAAKADVLFFIQSPGTASEGRTALADAAAQANARGFRTAVADLSEDESSRNALFAELRKKKLFDPLLGFSSASAAGDASAQALAQSMARLVTMKFLRDDTDRLQRAERSQIELTLVRMLHEFSYPRTVLPKLESALREWGADMESLGAARDRAEAFAREETSRQAEELFNEQFRRNAHAVTLSTGQRAYYEARSFQRLQLRFTWGTVEEPELRLGIYLPLVNILYPEKPAGALEWELLDSRPVDERLARRFEVGNWSAYPVDVPMVQVGINLNRREIPADGYTIRSRRRSGSVRRIEIGASSVRGAFNALGRLELLGADGRLNKDFQITENPALAQRGILERLSDEPWSHRDRLDMIRFLARVRMNRYYYAPIIDSQSRDRGAFGEPELDRLKELLHACDESFIDFVYAMRPDPSFSYASDADFSALASRLDNLAASGVHYFMLAFDDGESSLDNAGLDNAGLDNAGDREKFGALAAAQAHLVGRVYEHLKTRMQSFELSTAPGASLWSDGGYMREFSAGIPADVLIIAAPRAEMRSPTGADENRGHADSSGRRFVIRENYPSSADRRRRLDMGPKPVGNPKDVAGALGFVAAPISVMRASMPALATAAEYAWDPQRYDAAAAHVRALRMLYDERTAAGVTAFAATYSDPVFETLSRPVKAQVDSAAIERKLRALGDAIDSIGIARESGLLRGELAAVISDMRRTLDRIRRDDGTNEKERNKRN